jgi:diadenosine tetraphosphate (Ap4A) HIT family hydrolase
MPESPEELYARVISMAPDGRLAMPPITEWDTFPWEGELRVRPLLPPADELVRQGEGDRPCPTCEHPDHGVIWRNERWRVSAPDRPSGLPVVVWLMTHEHLDFEDMDDDLAAEYGRISSWLHRIIGNLPHVGQVHIGKWGDGSVHLHVWFMARTERIGQCRGNFATAWDDILPPPPEDVWRADLARIAQQLANHDGRAVVR